MTASEQQSEFKQLQELLDNGWHRLSAEQKKAGKHSQTDNKLDGYTIEAFRLKDFGKDYLIFLFFLLFFFMKIL